MMLQPNRKIQLTLMLVFLELNNGTFFTTRGCDNDMKNGEGCQSYDMEVEHGEIARITACLCHEDLCNASVNSTSFKILEKSLLVLVFVTLFLKYDFYHFFIVYFVLFFLQRLQKNCCIHTFKALLTF